MTHSIADSDMHTCQYCDGTLMSIRPPCKKCGHPLCDEIHTVIDYVTRFLFWKVKEKTTRFSYCPKCKTKNIISVNKHATTN